MPVSVSRASLIPYLGVDGLVLAPLGEDHTDTHTLAGTEPPLLTVVEVVDSPGAGLRHIATRGEL